MLCTENTWKNSILLRYLFPIARVAKGSPRKRKRLGMTFRDKGVEVTNSKDEAGGWRLFGSCIPMHKFNGLSPLRLIYNSNEVIRNRPEDWPIN